MKEYKCRGRYNLKDDLVDIFDVDETFARKVNSTINRLASYYNYDYAGCICYAWNYDCFKRLCKRDGVSYRGIGIKTFHLLKKVFEYKGSEVEYERKMFE